MLKDDFSQNRKFKQPPAQPRAKSPAPTDPRTDNRWRNTPIIPPVNKGDSRIQPFNSELQRLASQWSDNPETSSAHNNAQQNSHSSNSASTASADVEEFNMQGFILNDLYRIETFVARGGMGQVMLATHLQRRIPVVVKLMLEQMDPRDTRFQLFMQECMITARLNHPNLVKVLDYGILMDGLKPYLVMELINGESLRKTLKRKGKLEMKQVAAILMQAASGLEEVHSKRIIHRDLKPENIMVRSGPWQEDSVKVLDFGIAQLQVTGDTRKPGSVLGSLGYMSPEILCGKQPDLRTDIYSLGIIFYECVTGRKPFKGKTTDETISMHVKTPHVPPSTLIECQNPALVDRIAAKCLDKDPDERYHSAQSMKNDLRRLFES